MVPALSSIIRLARIKYELHITPPLSFWRYADLYQRLNDILKHLIQTTPFTDYVLDIAPRNQPHHGAFAILCMTESYEDVRPVLEGLTHQLTYLVTELEGPPTIAEGQAYLQRYFEAHAACPQCGGTINDHDVAYDPAQPLRDDHAHWQLMCHLAHTAHVNCHTRD